MVNIQQSRYGGLKGGCLSSAASVARCLPFALEAAEVSSGLYWKLSTICLVILARISTMLPSGIFCETWHCMWQLLFDASSIFATISSVSESSLYTMFCILHWKYGRSFSEQTFCCPSECTALGDWLVKCFSTPTEPQPEKLSQNIHHPLSALAPTVLWTLSFYIMWGALDLCWRCPQRDWTRLQWMWRGPLLMGLWRSIRTCRVY